MIIHILDDTEFILDLLRRELTGHDVHTFHSPEKFITSIHLGVHVIISDLKVSRYDVIKNIERFKEIAPNARIIVISAYFTEDILFKLIDAGVYKVVKKTHELDWFERVGEIVNGLAV